MPSYSFPTQVAVVIAGIYNFLHHSGFVDKKFARVETDDKVAKAELPTVEDEIQAEMNASNIQQSE